MAEATDASETTSKQTIERNIRALKRKLISNATEIKYIAEKGKAASSNLDEADSFKGMFRVLDRLYDKFENIWEEIIDIYEGEGKGKDFPTDRETTLRETVKSNYYFANTAFEKIKSQSACNMANVTISENKAPSSLHKIHLPRFNGTITDWPKFRDVFISLVHKEGSFSDIQKFHYLVSALSDEASSVVNNFKLVEENYNLAWNALCKAYDNKRLLASTYLNKILDFTPSQGKTSIENLKAFRHHISDNVAAFKLMNIANEADYILFHMGIRCLDPDSRKQFEREHANKDFPSFDMLNEFITEQITSFQLSEANTVKTFKDKAREPHMKKPYPNKQTHKQPSNSALFSNAHEQNSNVLKCIICSKDYHFLSKCEEFLNLSASERLNILNSKSWNGCKNCLSNSHSTNKCTSKWSCKFCQKRHNSLLHLPNIAAPTGPHNHTPKVDNERTSTSLNSTSSYHTSVLLGTARAEIKDLTGRYHPLRMVIDSGSQHSFITSSLINRLGLKYKKYQSPISGIGQTIFEGGKGKASIEIRPISSPQLTLITDAIIVKEITSHLPHFTLPISVSSPFQHLQLADETFWKIGPIDFLLGADLYGDIITGSPVTINEHLPKCVPSIFGNIILGRFNSNKSQAKSCSFFTVNQEDDIIENLKRFWLVEDINTNETKDSHVNTKCEEFFKSTFRRNEAGRYIISLPWKTSPPDFGEHESGPLRRYHNLDRRLNNAPNLKSQYVDFMKEYLFLNHMYPASLPSKYLIPHHAIFKEDRNQSKIRVVFDASFETMSGSLNNHLIIGPKLQQDIKTILQNFRIHPIVFVADIIKMYRQILVDEKDLPYQQIFWRFDDNEPVQKYQLRTLVYGLSCAPFLAMRVLRQLVLDEGHNFPGASHVLLNNIYVDDIVAGHQTIEEAQHLKTELIDLLKLGGFQLDKWASNAPDLLSTTTHSFENELISLQPKDDTFLKILGLQWMPKEDMFTYKITPLNPIVTKRSILSTIAKVYDPLGFISPTVLLMKGFLQELWKLKIDWDDNIPKQLEKRWREVTSQLTILSSLRIPRHISQNSKCSFKLIGFSDASSFGYCANIYILSTSETNVQVKLLTSKTKLAPLKTLSIPRLELCGALLLAKLYESLASFKDNLNISDDDVYFYTDSTIVLAWVKTPSYQLNTFVGNRVAEINRLTKSKAWNHVKSEENPADCGSRGILPGQLINNSLWWNGPKWLKNKMDEWPSSVIHFKGALPELKKSTCLISNELSSPIIDLTMRLSSYNKIINVVAWINRFTYNSGNPNSRIIGHLTLQEIKNAQLTVIKAVQNHYFSVTRGDPNRVLKDFNKLSPFIDDSGIVRVGGRLKNANISWNQKHPILLPKQSDFTKLLVTHLHYRYLHPGPNTLQAFIQSTYWIPSLRRLINQVTYKCLPCRRLKANAYSPMMADLPKQRVTPSRPFSQTGIDFAGPFICRESLRRKALTHKAYLALFVCMSTKAIHLEVVTSLSTEAFIAALHRFISRRGLPSDIYSDNATNFTGAANYLRDLSKWFDNEATRNTIVNFTNSLSIKWHFIPPHAPHFGGLWEAGVKSVKHHLRRTAGTTPLTFEELCTLFTRIEAVINSRPLTPLSNNPNETEFLSPAHFLIGSPIVTFPEPSLMGEKLNRLNRWQLIHHMTEELWKKWQLEYLATLQQRNKWNKKSENPLVGDLVLLKEDNTPPLHWPRGRITELHYGSDGIARVATVRTSDKVFKRSLSKLVPLL